MARLPSLFGDKDTWGHELTSFLLVAHNPDGTLREGGGGMSPLHPAHRMTIIDSLDPMVWYGWGSTPGTNYQDTSDGILAEHHISITPPDDDDYQEAIRREGLSLDLTKNILRIWVRADNPENLDRMRVFMITDPPSSNLYRKDFFFTESRDSPILGTDWQVLTVDPLDGENRGVVGTPDMSDVKGLRIDVNSYGEGATGTLHIGGIAIVPRVVHQFPKGVVSVTFDDNWDECWTDLRPVMANYGYRTTLYLIQDQVGPANRITMEQTRKLHDYYGWELAFHATSAATHAQTFTQMSEEELHEEFSAGQAWFIENGFPPCTNLSYPEGEYSPLVVDVARNYFKAGRTTKPQSYGQDLVIPPDLGYFRLKSRSLQNDISGWGAAYVDPMETYGGWFMMHGHWIGEEPGSGTVTLAQLDALLGYIHDKGIPVLPVGDVLQFLARPEVEP